MVDQRLLYDRAGGAAGADAGKVMDSTAWTVGAAPDEKTERRRAARRDPLGAMPFAVLLAACAACGGDGGNPAQPSPVTDNPTDGESDTAAARLAVDAWLALIDAGDYEAAYDAAAAFLRESVTAEEFRRELETQRPLLGALRSRTVATTSRTTTLPDAPPGDYIVFEFDAVFERRPDAGERVTAVLEAGEWRVVGYYLIR